MEINQIINLGQHCLHLCSSLNMEEIALSYLMDSDVFVTEDVEAWEKRFKEHNVNHKIKKPHEVEPKEAIVVDGSSLGQEFKKWEKKWKMQNKVICVYNIDKTELSVIKQLAGIHDKMILSTDKIRMISDKAIEREIETLDPELVSSLVKKELKNIIISLLLATPMSGADLLKVLYEKFKVFVSPGMLYPTLHDLKEKGLLEYEYKFKTKVYSVQEKEHAEDLLKKHAQANSLLSQFLKNGRL